MKGASRSSRNLEAELSAKFSKVSDHRHVLSPCHFIALHRHTLSYTIVLGPLVKSDWKTFFWPVKNPISLKLVFIFALERVMHTHTYSHLPCSAFVFLSREEKDRRLLCCQNCKCINTSTKLPDESEILAFKKRCARSQNFSEYATLLSPTWSYSIFSDDSGQRVSIQILGAR